MPPFHVPDFSLNPSLLRDVCSQRFMAEEPQVEGRAPAAPPLSRPRLLGDRSSVTPAVRPQTAAVQWDAGGGDPPEKEDFSRSLALLLLPETSNAPLPFFHITFSFSYLSLDSLVAAVSALGR